MENIKKYFGWNTLQDWSTYRLKESNNRKSWAITISRRLYKFIS